MADVKSEISLQFEKVAREHGKRLASLTPELILVDSGLDSLCFAVLITRLETSLGTDPFDENEDLRFPITFGDFVRLYENALK